MVRVKRINIDVPREVIIVEKFDNIRGCILEGSRLYCGCCGYVMGVCIEEIQFPFDRDKLSQDIGNRSFYINGFGLYHVVCGYMMFRGRMPLSFIEVDSYFHQVYKQKVVRGIGLN